MLSESVRLGNVSGHCSSVLESVSMVSAKSPQVAMDVKCVYDVLGRVWRSGVNFTWGFRSVVDFYDGSASALQVSAGAWKLACALRILWYGIPGSALSFTWFDQFYDQISVIANSF